MIPDLTEHIADVRRRVMASDDKGFIDIYYHTTQSPILTSEKQALLRRRISDHFKVSMRDVILVGSAKIGCTLTQKPKRPPLSPFSDSSDIDIAIISNRLFVEYWEKSFAYHEEVREWPDLNQFRKYLFRGWLRPDKLPVDTEFPLRQGWFEYFLAQTASGEFGGHKVTAGIYYAESFWEKYAARVLVECRKHIELESKA